MRVETIAALGIAAVVTGCTYYKVINPASGRAYYTQDVDRKPDGITIMFTDVKTSAQVTLQSAEVVKVSSDEFKKATAK
jgi:hypothetical protein